MKIILRAIVLLVFSCSFSIAATFTSVVSGNWNVGTTWGNGACAPCIAGTHFPGPLDLVIVASGHSIIVNVSASCAGLTINSATSNQDTELTIGQGITLTVNGNTTIGGGSGSKQARISIVDNAVLDLNGNLTFSSSNANNAEIALSNTAIDRIPYVYLSGNIILSTAGTIGYSNSTSSSFFVFDGTSAQTLTIPNTFDFQNISFNNTSAQGITLATPISTQRVSQGITVSSGIFSDNGFSIAGNSGFEFRVNTGATYNVQGTALPSGFTRNFQAGSIINFSGAFTSLGGTFSNLTLSGSAAKILTSNLIVSQVLTMSGSTTITTGVNRVEITPTTSGSLVSSGTARIVGNLRRNVIANTSYDFPVGSATNLQRANLNLTSNAGITFIDASFSATTPATTALTNFTANAATYTNLLTTGFWVITPNAGTATYNLSLAPSFLTGFGSYAIVKRAAPYTGNWAADGTVSNPEGTTTGIQSDGTIRRTGMSGFSNQAVAGSASPQPVELINFTASLDKTTVNLDWSTASEFNSDYFAIERSVDGKIFSTVGKIKSAGFNTTLKEYTFKDFAYGKTNGLYYYRLRQVDFDGQYKIYPAVSVDFKADLGLTMFPNPANDKVTLVNNTAKPVTFEVLNTDGNSIYKGEIASIQELSLLQLTVGVYIVKFSNADAVTYKRLVIAR